MVLLVKPGSGLDRRDDLDQSVLRCVICCAATIAVNVTRIGTSCQEQSYNREQLLLTGDDRVSAERALAIGLVNRVVPRAELDETTRELAMSIAVNDRLAVELTKQAINRGCEIAGMRQAMLQALELDVVIESTDTPESRAFEKHVQSDGVKAALAWREAQMKGTSDG